MELRHEMYGTGRNILSEYDASYVPLKQPFGYRQRREHPICKCGDDVGQFEVTIERVLEL